MSKGLQPGATIGKLMNLVLFLGVLLAILRPQSRTIEDLLIVLVIFFSLRFVVLPIWVVGRQRVTADPPIDPFDPEAEETPEEVRTSIRTQILALETLGFTVRGHLHRGNPGLRGQAYVTLLANFQACQTMRLFTVIVNNREVRRVETSLLFRTDFTDGSRMITANNRTAAATPSPLRNRNGSMALPDIRDAAVLYKIHQEAIVRYASDGLRRLPDMANLAEYLRSSTKEEFDSWLEHGYYFLDEHEHAYRPTWKGAVLMGLRFSAPFRRLRERLRRRRASRFLKKLEIAQ